MYEPRPPRPPRPFPVYPRNPLKHSGGASIKINQKAYYLGQHGSQASYAEYERLRLAHAAGSLGSQTRAAAGPAPAGGLGGKPGGTIAELVAVWYVADPRGREDGEVIRTARACVKLVELFGETQARDFTAMRLEEIQVAMLDLGTWSRGYVNSNIDRIRRVFRWAETKGHVAPGTWQHLKAVAPIRRNNRRARNTAPRKPCDWERQVVPAMEWMYPQVKAMVLVQFYGGMRPGEIVTMRRSEIDQAGPEGCWVYRPATHKGTHRGQELAKVLGPQAQAVLGPWLLRAEPAGFVFPPVRDRYGLGRFRVEGYHRSICDACTIARVERFTAYQLRHLAKMLATRAFGLDDARAYLGQLSLGATALYARQQDLEAAAKVARKIG